MSTDEVLASIDAACADWEVSDDAVRYNAPPEQRTEDPGYGHYVQRVVLPLDGSVVWFAEIGDDGEPGEWHEVGALNTGPFAPLSPDDDLATWAQRALGVDRSHFEGRVHWPSELSRRGLTPLGDAAYRPPAGCAE